MPDRFIFRQVYYKDIPLFLADGEVRAKNHASPQLCHQTSYPEIVDRRGGPGFGMPCGGVVNDYVPFYFSPITGFTFTISQGNVALRSPANDHMGIASQRDRAFLVFRADRIFQSGLKFYFSNFALNTLSAEVVIEDNPNKLSNTINWELFDDSPTTARITEIGYEGVCSWFHDRATPAAHQNRKRQRMAEFLIKGAVPLDLIECIVVQNDDVKDAVLDMIKTAGLAIPVFVKPGCYY